MFLVLLISVVGCYWNDEESVYPDPDICDTLDVSFALDILPILTNNCFNCHSNKNAPDFTFGFALQDYEDIAAASNRIIGAVNHLDGFSKMPKGAEMLDSCLINILEAWVNQGSLNN